MIFCGSDVDGCAGEKGGAGKDRHISSKENSATTYSFDQVLAGKYVDGLERL